MTRSTTGPAPAAPLPSPKERRRLREARALSEEQVAAAVGVTPATVRAWETGRMDPRGRRRTAYAKLLGCEGHRPAPSPSVEAPGSSTMPPAEPGIGTGTASEAPTPREPASAVPTPTAPASDVPTPTAPAPKAPTPKTPASEAPTPKAPALGVPAQEGCLPVPTAPAANAPAPQPPPALTAEEAYDALYSRIAPGLTRQMYLLTGRRKLAREAVGHAFRTAWQRWPEVARDRDPAGWVRAASYEYAMSPWHRLRRSHRLPDPMPDDPARRALLDALLGLPPAYRRTLLLHDGVGLGLPETAAETEASTPATASRLLNARAAVAERLPGTVEPTEPGGKPALHDPLGALALAEEVPEPPPAPVVRAGGERVAELWTRAALCFGVLLIGTTAFTLHTAPTQYEQPLAPAERVGGVPPRGGPEKLTPQDLKLQKSLRDELTHGPERLVPRIP
ncbi:helix-turn-helix domain-containing protein [Streptomyces sp. NPDC006175]|uniref:helix-turn-helix domain-containing protein n=1 Tax=Streptomyces sp. NPDC006175 TaxID=3154471 RepID=UPI0033AF1582